MPPRLEWTSAGWRPAIRGQRAELSCLALRTVLRAPTGPGPRSGEVVRSLSGSALDSLNGVEVVLPADSFCRVSSMACTAQDPLLVGPGVPKLRSVWYCTVPRVQDYSPASLWPFFFHFGLHTYKRSERERKYTFATVPNARIAPPPPRRRAILERHVGAAPVAAMADSRLQ